MVSTLAILNKYLKNIEAHNSEINAVLELRPIEELEKEAKVIDKKIKAGEAGKLAGKIILVKACINVKGLRASCASKVLENYEATYDATAVKKIKHADGLIIGTTNMDEFASGGSGETSAFGPTLNPKNKKRIPGGSSSGSAAAVAAEFCDIALGSDTGGSIRNPASHCGIVGIKPTYSSVSRYGLIDLSMSLDQIGPLARTVEDAELILDVISGADELDSISQEAPKLEKVPKKLKVGVLDLSKFNIDKRISEIIASKIEELKSAGHEIVNVKIPHLDLAVSTYYPLVYVEMFSGTRKLDGRRYGEKIEDTAGPEVMRRILGGSEITKAEYGGQYYNKALRAKKIIEKEFDKVFTKVDCLIMPTVPGLPWKIGGEITIEEGYAADALTIPANLAGICAISVPAGEVDSTPVGIQIMCDKFKEGIMLSLSKELEK